MKSESRDHICPRCGSYLPTVTVKVPVYDLVDVRELGESVDRSRTQTGYEEREEVAECVRCTGSY